VPVADGAAVGARFHIGSRGHANLLFFHGNGEIAADYDEIGPYYNRIGINFLAADYRGYGPLDRAPHGDLHDAGRSREFFGSLRNGWRRTVSPAP